MRQAGSLVYLAASVAPLLAVAAADGPRPKGVGPDFAKFYKDQESFTCISNPSVKIPFSRVNDDFCDCPDGSDEPGTAACAALSPLSPSSPADTGIADKINATLALPGFYCKNKGHTPTYIPFTLVNDGVCDYDVCCDGSDEWQGPKKCEDRCGPIGTEARRVNREVQKSLNAANNRRKELVLEAARLRKQVEEQIKNLETQVHAAEVKIEGARQVLKDTEKRERGRMARGTAGGKSGEVGILVNQAKQRTTELREHLVRVRQERDASKTRLDELEGLLRTFKEEYNPNFNDEGVKRAVRAWEDYAARDKGLEIDPASNIDLDEISKTDEEAGLDWESFTRVASSDNPELELLYSFEAYLPTFARDWVDEQLRNLRQSLIDNGILAAARTSSDDGSGAAAEPRAVSEARTAVTTAETDLANLQASISSHRADLDAAYGADGVFRALKGKCVSTPSGEYRYEACFMGATTQKPKKQGGGGGDTNMGHFTKFEELDFDEAVQPDGKGIGQGRRVVMRFENGQHCWNGPNRSTTVVLVCAEEDALWKITEEEKCVYRMVVGTSAVCGKGAVDGSAAAGLAKDEL